MYNKILVANDGSKGGYAALDVAISLAKHFSAELHMITIEEVSAWGMTGDVAPVMVFEEQRRYLEEVVAHSVTKALLEDITLQTTIPIGEPVGQISDFAEGFDLLVIGFSPHSAAYLWFVGSVSQEVVAGAPCSVLVVKIPDEDE